MTNNFNKFQHKKKAGAKKELKEEREKCFIS